MGFGSLRNCVIGLLSFLQLALELWAGFWGLFAVELAGCSPVLFSFQFRESIVLLIRRYLHFGSIEQFYLLCLLAWIFSLSNLEMEKIDFEENHTQLYSFKISLSFKINFLRRP